MATEKNIHSGNCSGNFKLLSPTQIGIARDQNETPAKLFHTTFRRFSRSLNSLTSPSTTKVRIGSYLFNSITTLIIFAAFAVPSFGQSAHHKKFIQALKEKGYYDVAESYLDSAENSKWLSSKEKKSLLIQKATLGYHKAVSLRSYNDVAAQWDISEAAASKYLDVAQDLESKLEALELLQKIQEGRAGQTLQKAKLDRSTIWENASAATNARAYFQNAAKYYGQSVEVIRSQLKAIRSSGNKELRSTFLPKSETFLRYLILRNVHHENVALTFPPDSTERKQHLEKLVASYEALAKKYYNRAPYNEYYRGYKGRCLAKLKRWKEGSKELEDVFLRSEATYLPLQISLIPSALECWKNQDKPVVEPAITHLENIVKRIPPKQAEEPSHQLAVYYLAKLHSDKANKLSKIEKPKPLERRNLRTAQLRAENLLKTIKKSKSKAGKFARELIVANGGKVKELKSGPPEDFAEAFSRATDQFRQLASLSENNGTGAAVNPTIENHANLTLSALDLANQMAGSSATATDKNLIRYYRCYCFWKKKRYAETALMGEFMLKRFPNLNGTVESVSIATQAYFRQILAGQKANKDVSFERARLSELCKQVLKKWPDNSAAGDVSFLLLFVANGQKDWQQVRLAADQIPVNHPKYSAGQLYSGLGIYDRSIRLRRQIAELKKETKTTEEQLAKLNREQQALQNEGASRLQKCFDTFSGSPTKQHYEAADKLAGFLNSQKKYSEAFRFLNSPTLDTFKKIKNGNQASLSKTLQLRLIRNGLLSSLSTGISGENVSQAITQSDPLVDLLRSFDQKEEAVRSYLKAAENVVLIRFGQLARVARNASDRQVIAQACLRNFQTVPETSDGLATLNNLGNTLQSVSDSLGSGQSALKRKLNSLASKCYDKGILVASRTPKTKPYVRQFRLGKAATLRGEGKYQQASSEVQKILVESPKLATAQIEACKIYQQWGQKTRNPSHIAVALVGGVNVKVAGGRNRRLVQGWQRLAQSTIGSKKNEKIFYTAFVGLAQSQVEYGRLTKKTKYYQSVLKQIAREKKRSSDLGGPVVKNQLEQIARRTQKLLGKPQSGLSGL